MDPQLLDVIKFQKLCDPIAYNPWGLCSDISQNNIKKAINNNNLVYPPLEDSGSDHVARIAWFVVHGWDHPIEVDVGVPSCGCNPLWPLEDGNHRFAAAIIRGDLSILANMSGAVSEIEPLLYRDTS
jgi:hypothetical protein